MTGFGIRDWGFGLGASGFGSWSAQAAPPQLIRQMLVGLTRRFGIEERVVVVNGLTQVGHGIDSSVQHRGPFHISNLRPWIFGKVDAQVSHLLHTPAMIFNSCRIDVHIRSLRNKLGPEGRRIFTVRNVGYRLDPVLPE